jgi:hypothetical protein
LFVVAVCIFVRLLSKNNKIKWTAQIFYKAGSTPSLLGGKQPQLLVLFSAFIPASFLRPTLLGQSAFSPPLIHGPPVPALAIPLCARSGWFAVVSGRLSETHTSLGAPDAAWQGWSSGIRPAAVFSFDRRSGVRERFLS